MALIRATLILPDSLTNTLTKFMRSLHLLIYKLKLKSRNNFAFCWMSHGGQSNFRFCSQFPIIFDFQLFFITRSGGRAKKSQNSIADRQCERGVDLKEP